MADFTYSVESAQRLVVRLRTPSNAAELDKAVQYCVQRVRNEMSSTLYDDTIAVHTADDEVLLIIMLKDWSAEKSDLATEF